MNHFKSLYAFAHIFIIHMLFCFKTQQSMGDEGDEDNFPSITVTVSMSWRLHNLFERICLSLLRMGNHLGI